MVFQHDVADVDMCLACGVAEVEHKLDGAQLLARHVALPEDVVLTGLQVHLMLVDDGLRVVFVGQLHHHALDVAVAVEDAREVVVDGRRGDEVGMEVNLCLPLRITCLWDIDGIVVVTQLEE